MTELTDALQEMVAERSNPGSTHYDGCWRNHLLCAALFAADELAALQAENERLREAITDALHWAQVAIDAPDDIERDKRILDVRMVLRYAALHPQEGT